jgi:hypothetical protein
MRSRRFLVAAVLLLIGFYLFLQFVVSPSIRLIAKSQTYYKQLADAFELVRQQHPLDTNFFVEVEVTDPTTPKMIQDLNPHRILCSRDGAVAIIGVGMFPNSIGWHRDNTGTNGNTWVLQTRSGIKDKTVYSRTSP